MTAESESVDTGGLPERLIDFVTALRTKGIMVGTGETVDAADAMRVIGLDNRNILREGLATTVTRRSGQRETFDAIFDIYFPAKVGRPQSADEADESLTVDVLRDLLVEALADIDMDALEELAEIAVDRFGEISGDTRGWSALRALDQVQPQTLLARTLAMRGSSGVDDRLALSGTTEREDVRALIGEYRTMVEAEARRRTSEVRGRDAMAEGAVAAQSEHIEFLSANSTQFDELRRSVRPLARRLATRLAARRKRSYHNSIDIRKTLRHSLSTGGVPINLILVKPRATRPDLVLLCDVSGSVAGFSNFTMLLVQAMRNQFRKIRVFAFVNAMDDVTDLIEPDTDEDGEGLQNRIVSQARVTKGSSSSDYGTAFAEFVAEHLDSIGSRTSVLILGDARSNYRPPGLEDVRDIAARSRRTFWLNPEQMSFWGVGDSVAADYAGIVEMHECRTVEQLSQFVTRLLPV